MFKVIKSSRDTSEMVDLQLRTVPEYDHDAYSMNLWFEHHGTPKSMIQHGPPAPNTATISGTPHQSVEQATNLPSHLRPPSHSIETSVGRSLTPLLDHAPREPNRDLALDHRSTSRSGPPRAEPWPCFGSPIHIYSGELTSN